MTSMLNDTDALLARENAALQARQRKLDASKEKLAAAVHALADD